jgi:hypothetical protein
MRSADIHLDYIAVLKIVDPLYLHLLLLILLFLVQVLIQLDLKLFAQHPIVLLFFVKIHNDLIIQSLKVIDECLYFVI